MFQISLRQILFLMALIALAIASLLNASPFWEGVIWYTAMIVAFAAVGVGIFDRGPRRAFAVGCAIALFSYALLIENGREGPNGRGSVGNMELNVRSAQPQLPTTKLLAHIYQRIEKPTNRPPSESFTPIGHYWAALLLGFLSGRFARGALLRRLKETPAPTNE